MEKLSVLIPTFNSENIIRDCLESVKWADEILICDSFSTDRTLEICRQYTDRIVQHEYINPAKQKNWALPRCHHGWVLVIDSDERVGPELRQEIATFLQEPPDGIDCCRIARKNVILGKWLQLPTLWPDYCTRLVRRDVARCNDKEVHEDFVAPGGLVTFQNALVHLGTPSISKQIGLLDRYTRYQAAEFEKQGRKFSWRRMLVRPAGAFIYYYLWRRGFTAGFRGFFLAVHAAIYSFYTYSKLWEQEWRAKEMGDIKENTL